MVNFLFYYNQNTNYFFSTPEQLYQDFDMSEMAFNPPVPVPKKVAIKEKSQRHLFADAEFKNQCKNTVRAHLKRKGGLLC